MLNLVEYGKPVLRHKMNTPIERIRQESLLWKSRLGLQSLPISVEYAGPDEFLLRAQGVTGAFQVDNFTIEIQPKFLEYTSATPWKQALFHILTIVDTLPPFSYGPPADVGGEEVFADLIGHALLSGMNIAREEGYPRGYVEIEGLLPSLRGRLDTASLNALLLNPTQVSCIYDEYSEDVAINRLLRWAAYQLSGMVRSRYLAQQLIEVADTLINVSIVPPGIIEADYLTMPIQYGYLQPALDVARMLLRQQSLQYQQGQFQGISFLWKSFEVFEQFVRHLLTLVCAATPSWNVDAPTLTLATATQDKQRALKAYPDYVIRDRKRKLLILDAKYKSWPLMGSPDVSNVYQVMAYGRLEDCSHVCLIYPRSSNSPTTLQTWKIGGTSNPIFVHAIFIDLIVMSQATGEQQLIKCLKSDLYAIFAT